MPPSPPPSASKSATHTPVATTTGTKTYILRSTLDPALIELACSPDADIRELEQKENRDDNQEFAEDDNPIGTRSTGSIFAWQNADQLPSIGILYVILALILVEGRVISDSQSLLSSSPLYLTLLEPAGDLRAILKRLQLPPSAPIPLSSQASNQSVTIDAYLAQLMRQGYIEKLHAGSSGKGGGAKRARATQATQAADDAHLQAFEWRWGPRALGEIGEPGIARFVSEFMAGQPGQEDDEDEDAVRASQDEHTQKRVEVIFNGIQRAAAGGELIG